jgi:hypothetical protein
MPLFHRKPNVRAVPAPASGLRCQAQGCTSDDAIMCAYRDRRGRRCRATFCVQHLVVVDDVSYCRRHGGTMRALGTRGAVRAGLPDIDNRGPSLVQHVANQLEQPVVALLQSVARPQEQVIEEVEVTKAFEPNRSSRWERSWRLVDGTGVVIKVTVFVTEADSATVSVRAGSHIVFEEVPPWIRSRRGDTARDDDAVARRQFYERLETTIADAVVRSRESADHPVWVH